MTDMMIELDKVYNNGVKDGIKIGRQEMYEEFQNAEIKAHDDLLRKNILKELKFNLDNEKATYMSNGHNLDVEKWINDYIESQIK